ncbi:MAG: hypothetical protein PHP50_13945 [Lachnospiraceae bacterium]|nr:hypothetical protein [Lachnospiraceae bacterium]
MIVLYTADVKPHETEEFFDVGAVQLTIEEAFLSELNSEEIRERLTGKIYSNEALTNKELMEFAILPLTYEGKEQKKAVIKELFSAAKEIRDERTQIFLLTGVMVFSDKIIDEKTANQMKEWIMMTKVSKLFEKEKQEAMKKTAQEVIKEVTKEVASETALAMLKEGDSIEKVARCIKVLSFTEIEALADSLEKWACR